MTRSLACQGFTLIELLVVMTVIALLLTIATPRYFAAIDRAKEATLRENLAVMRDAIDKFFADKQAYPTSLQELVTQRYLRAVPIDPLTERADTWQLVPPVPKAGAAAVSGVFDVHSGAPGKAPDGSDYARW